MSGPAIRSRRRGRGLLIASLATLPLAAGAALSVGVALLAVLSPPGPPCPAPAAAGSSSIVLAPAGEGRPVGASEYGGPGDPSSGSVGASGANLLQHPDSYAELGGYTFETATAMGGLPYMTPLRITRGARSVIAYKRDFGFGGGPVDGLPRVIDLWWQLAAALGIPYEDGLWSGPVRIARTPPTGAGNALGQAAGAAVAASAPTTGEAAMQSLTSGPHAACPAPAPAGAGGVPLTSGPRAALLPDGLAAAPRGAPAAVRGMIAAGNEIVGKPYLYGGGHGLPLDEVAPAYDCSSSVEHVLHGGGLLPATYDAASGMLESLGLAGPGRWVTIYASTEHVFMYVAGLRWDTWNAAGAQDGTTGIGWHPLVRSSAGFVARHPVGL